MLALAYLPAPENGINDVSNACSRVELEGIKNGIKI